MARKIGHIFHDILEAIERIENVTRGKSLAEFERSWELRWLVQRGIEIISEASRAIPEELKAARPEISWAQVRDKAMSCGINIKDFPTRSFGKS
jgi:uncharacterized protein with HEPN domain